MPKKKDAVKNLVAVSPVKKGEVEAQSKEEAKNVPIKGNDLRMLSKRSNKQDGLIYALVCKTEAVKQAFLASIEEQGARLTVHSEEAHPDGFRIDFKTPNDAEIRTAIKRAKGVNTNATYKYGKAKYLKSAVNAAHAEAVESLKKKKSA